MNLTIVQVSKITKLSVPTLYSYASRRKLGKKVGKNRVFSKADVQKLLKGSRKSPVKKKPKPPIKKALRSKKSAKLQPIKATVVTPKDASSIPSTQVLESTKPSFWTRLFGGRKQQKKDSLLEAEATKMKREAAARIKHVIAHP